MAQPAQLRVGNETYSIYRLDALQARWDVARLPYTLRILLENVLRNVCPNCGGGFQPRPIRPVRAWRDGTGLAHDPPGERRRHTRYAADEVATFVATVRDIPPAER